MKDWLNVKKKMINTHRFSPPGSLQLNVEDLAMDMNTSTGHVMQSMIENRTLI